MLKIISADGIKFAQLRPPYSVYDWTKASDLFNYSSYSCYAIKEEDGKFKIRRAGVDFPHLFLLGVDIESINSLSGELSDKLKNLILETSIASNAVAKHDVLEYDYKVENNEYQKPRQKYGAGYVGLHYKANMRNVNNTREYYLIDVAKATLWCNMYNKSPEFIEYYKAHHPFNNKPDFLKEPFVFSKFNSIDVVKAHTRVNYNSVNGVVSTTGQPVDNTGPDERLGFEMVEYKNGAYSDSIKEGIYNTNAAMWEFDMLTEYAKWNTTYSVWRDYLNYEKNYGMSVVNHNDKIWYNTVRPANIGMSFFNLNGWGVREGTIINSLHWPDMIQGEYFKELQDCIITSNFDPHDTKYDKFRLPDENGYMVFTTKIIDSPIHRNFPVKAACNLKGGTGEDMGRSIIVADVYRNVITSNSVPKAVYVDIGTPEDDFNYVTQESILGRKKAVSYPRSYRTTIENFKYSSIWDEGGKMASPRLQTNLHAYLLTYKQAKSFTDMVCTKESFADISKFAYGEAIDTVVMFKWFPLIRKQITEQGGTYDVPYIQTGAKRHLFSNDATVKRLSNEFVTFFLECPKIKRHFNNYLDYSPYTEIELYIPFYGTVTLNPEDVYDQEVKIQYKMVVTTGTFEVSVYTSRIGGRPIITERFAMGLDIPLNKPQHSTIMDNIASTLGAAGAGFAVGGIAGAAAGAAGGLAMGALGSLQMQGYKTTAGASSANGEMAFFYPRKVSYTIRRPQIVNSGGHKTLIGGPLQEIKRVGDCSGLIKMIQVDSSSIDEMNQFNESILAILVSGIYL